MKTFAVLVAAVSMVVGCAGEASDEDIADDVDSTEADATAAAPALEAGCNADVNVKAKITEMIAALKRQEPNGVIQRLPASQLPYGVTRIHAQKRTVVSALITFPIVLQTANKKFVRSVQCRIGQTTDILPNGQTRTTQTDPKVVVIEVQEPTSPPPPASFFSLDPVQACLENRDVANSIAKIGPALARNVGAPARIGAPVTDSMLYAVSQVPGQPLGTQTFVTFRIGVAGSNMNASRSTQCRVVQRNGKTTRVDLVDVDLF